MTGGLGGPQPIRRTVLALGATLYVLGAALALFWIAMVARADTSLLRVDGPAAPALELQRGVYEIRDGSDAGSRSPETAVFVLKTREVLPLSESGGGRSFEVPAHGIYVLDLRTEGSSATIHARERLVLSPTLIFALTLAPVGTLPGLFLLDGARPRRRRELELGRSRFTIASVRRRLIAVVFDLVAIAALLMLLILAAPLFSLGAPLIPLAPIAYVWSGAARGSSIGRWLTGIRVVDARGQPPGAWVGLLRSALWLLSWAFLGAGYVVAALGTAGRAPHDAVAGTYVVVD